MAKPDSTTLRTILQSTIAVTLTVISVLLGLLLTQLGELRGDVRSLGTAIQNVQIKVAEDYLTKNEADRTYQRKIQ